MLSGSIIDAPEVPVRYVAGDGAKSIPEQALAAFEQLESSLGSLRGRKFYGVAMAGEYKACVAASSDQSSDSLPVYRIPGGRYFCHRIDDFLTDPGRISERVEQLIGRSDFDSSRPVIEFYRKHNQLSIRIPVK